MQSVGGSGGPLEYCAILNRKKEEMVRMCYIIKPFDQKCIHYAQSAGISVEGYNYSIYDDGLLIVF